MIPYAGSAETADRRRSFRLLDRLVTPELFGDERDEVVSAMPAVSDRRTGPILERLLADRPRPAATREAADEIIRGVQCLDIEWPEATLRGWCGSREAVLGRPALLTTDAAARPAVVCAAAGIGRRPSTSRHGVKRDVGSASLTDKELPDLTRAVVAINGWNGAAISLRTVRGRTGRTYGRRWSPR